MIETACILEYGNGKMEPEFAAVREVLEARGIPCKLFTEKRVRRRQVPMNSRTLVVADHPQMQALFNQIAYQPPRDCYPTVLRPFLRRAVKTMNLSGLRAAFRNENLPTSFIKPRSRTKLFTGFVLRFPEDLARLDAFSGQTEIYLSPVVEWLSEVRIFIQEGKIIGEVHYEGDSQLQINEQFVEAAVAALESSPGRTAAYALDFGVLGNGETALVEWNDGYALGAYGLSAEHYTDFLIRRWQDIPF